MAIYDHLEQFAGLPIVDWSSGQELVNPATSLYRIRVDYDESDSGVRWTDRFAELLDDPEADRLAGIVVGAGEWLGSYDQPGGSTQLIEALVAARRRLSNLRALFLGDVTVEEAEISWIEQTDIAPLFEAYPALEHLGLRGSNRLRLGTVQHEHLKTLVIQSSGLDARIVRQIATAHLPALEHLELWLGAQEYGGDTSVHDLLPIFSGARLPNLRYLGLRNSTIADQLAAALAGSALLQRISVLDLSLGTLGDAGAGALLADPATARLEKLDIHHHYCSTEMVDRLRKLGMIIDADQQQAGQDHERRIAITE